MSQNLREALRSIARSNQATTVFVNVVYNIGPGGKLVLFNGIESACFQLSSTFWSDHVFLSIQIRWRSDCDVTAEGVEQRIAPYAKHRSMH